jgi:hypothetical protein
MSTSDPTWRVSVATLNRVIIRDNPGASPLLVLERAATLFKDKALPPVVLTKPFGGAVRILDGEALRRHIGNYEFDSSHSQSEQDFRILVPTAAWDRLKQFCVQHLAKPGDPILETSPQRELAEEFMDALHIQLQPGQVFINPAGFVFENTPAPTGNLYSRGFPTVRIYRIFEVEILESSLRSALLENSRRYSDLDLQAMAAADAAHGGKGRANAILALSLEAITQAYHTLPLPQRASPLEFGGHLFDPSVIAVLENVDTSQYDRLSY